MVVDPSVPGKDRPSASVRCDCGTEKIVRTSHLRNETIRSCGCLAAEARTKWNQSEAGKQHILELQRSPLRRARVAEANHRRGDGICRHPLYNCWNNMIRRCENPKDDAYPSYGGRGIKVCERWHDSRLFVQDIESEIGPRPVGRTLDRIDNDGDYEPGNVRWATPLEQVANRRTVIKLQRQLDAAKDKIAELQKELAGYPTARM